MTFLYLTKDLTKPTGGPHNGTKLNFLSKNYFSAKCKQIADILSVSKQSAEFFCQNVSKQLTYHKIVNWIIEQKLVFCHSVMSLKRSHSYDFCGSIQVDTIATILRLDG